MLFCSCQGMRKFCHLVSPCLCEYVTTRRSHKSVYLAPHTIRNKAAAHPPSARQGTAKVCDTLSCILQHSLQQRQLAYTSDRSGPDACAAGSRGRSSKALIEIRSFYSAEMIGEEIVRHGELELLDGM